MVDNYTKVYNSLPEVLGTTCFRIQIFFKTYKGDIVYISYVAKPTQTVTQATTTNFSLTFIITNTMLCTLYFNCTVVLPALGDKQTVTLVGK